MRLREAERVATRVASLSRPAWRLTEAALSEQRDDGLKALKLYGMPLRPLPDHVVAAAERAAREAAPPTPSRGMAVLREAVAEKVSVGRRAAVNPEETLVTNGAMQAINVVCRSLLNPGEEVLMPGPVFFFYGAIQLAGGVPKYVISDEGADWRWDLDRLESAITPMTKLLLLCSPVNPTGYVVPRLILEGVADIAKRHELLVLVDESYDRMVYEDEFVSASAVPELLDNLILVQSLTKSYAMPAWRIGFIVASQTLINEFSKVLEWEVLYVNAVCQAAAAAAISGPQDWLAGVSTEFQAYRDRVWPEIASIPGIRIVRPRATPYMFANVTGLGVTGDEFARQLVETFAVPAAGGSHFGSEHHVRVGFGAFDEWTQKELCTRIRMAAEQC